MKGFKDSTRMKSGFGFSSKHGFTGSTGNVQSVKGYTRKTPIRKATGGKVEGIPVTKASPKDMVYDGDATTIGDQGNAAELRTKSITEFDKGYGGKGPLRPGFAAGGPVGMAGPLRMAVAAQQQRPMMRTAIPRGPMARRPLMRAEGGKVPPKKPTPPPPPPPTDTNKGTTVGDILQGRKKQMEDLGLKKGGQVPMHLNLKKGALHKSMGISQDKKIPVARLNKAANSDNELTRKRAQFAINARKWNHKAEGGAVHSDAAQDRPMMQKIAKQAVMKHVGTPAPKGHKGMGNLFGK